MGFLNVQTCVARDSLRATHEETTRKPRHWRRYGRNDAGRNRVLIRRDFDPPLRRQTIWVDTDDCTSNSTCSTAFSYSV